ncbi:hypothetical protein P43SY_002573 [Pythium insidiosum]|uniref:Major facilitator superfamily (MFS) profile domain-containing protein n=1 Tax=Pythium insidiosum TaxID=114742 RepID=A0AAD5MA45_PYTIN|nr:hypothetical protein P43SY_002573 [Pythium insidiosum]
MISAPGATDRSPLLNTTAPRAPLVYGTVPQQPTDDDPIDKSGRSIRSDGGGSDAKAFDAMMQLSVSRNPLRHESFRAFIIWLITSCILFLTNQLTTLPVGFFPLYAAEMLHMSPAQLSLFFSMYPLCIMISSPLAAFYSPAIGRQTIICVGMVISGATTIAFAYTTSVAAVFILRILQGLGAGAAVVGAFSMITEEFSSNIGQILVIQEFIVAAAFVTAPPIGSALYQYHGYQLPFLASGVAQLVVVMMVPFLFIEYTLPDGLYSKTSLPTPLYAPAVKAGVHFRDVLTPTCVVCLALTTFAMASFGFIDPYLGSHLQTVLGAQHIAIGFGFGLSALVYFLGGIIYVWLSRNCGCKQVILLGLFLLSMGFLFLGPPPFLNSFFDDSARLWVTQWLSLVFIGCGAALSIAPGLPLTLMSVATSGNQAFNLVIGLFSAAIYLGQAIGPFLALGLTALLPATHSPNCVVTKDASAPRACVSSLPWAFTVYSGLALVMFTIVATNLSTGEAIVELLESKRRFSLNRQASEYGQFVFFDDDLCDDEDDMGIITPSPAAATLSQRPPLPQPRSRRVPLEVTQDGITFATFKALWRDRRISAAFHIEFWDSTPSDVHRVILQQALDVFVACVAAARSADAASDAVLRRCIAATFALYTVVAWTSLSSTFVAHATLGHAVREARAMVSRLLDNDEEAFLRCLGTAFIEYRSPAAGDVASFEMSATDDAVVVPSQSRDDNAKHEMLERLEALSLQYSRSMASLRALGTAASVAATARGATFLIPARPAHQATSGRPLRVFVNHFPMRYDASRGDIFQYDVKIDRAQPSTDDEEEKASIPTTTSAAGEEPRASREMVLSASLRRRILRAVLSSSSEFQSVLAVSDWQKNIFTTVRLPHDNFRVRGVVPLGDTPGTCRQVFDVVVQYAAIKHMTALDALFQQRGGSVPPTPYDVLQALDVAMRHTVSLRFELSKPLVEFCCDVLGIRELRPPLSHALTIRLSATLRNLRVEVTHQPGTSRRIYRVNSVTTQSAEQLTFPVDSDGGRVSTVAAFFAQQYAPLRYPQMPCVHVGAANRHVYLPLEVCVVASKQRRAGRLSEQQTTQMLRVAQENPTVRKRKIEETLVDMQYAQDPVLPAFGLRVEPQMLQATARVLDAPVVTLGRNHTVQPQNAAMVVAAEDEEEEEGEEAEVVAVL